MSTAVRQGLYTKLASETSVTSTLATTTSIFHGQAPVGAQYPFIIFAQMAGVRTRAMQANAFSTETWMVKVVDRGGSSNVAEAIAEAVDAVLDLGEITVAGRALADLHHVGDIDYLEPDGDQLYRHHGATYRAVTTTS